MSAFAFPDRLDCLRTKLDEQGLDAILISNAQNRRYLSGFAGSAGHLVVSRNEAVLATDFRYTEQAAAQAPGFRVQHITASLDWLPRVAAETGAKQLGFEADSVTVADFARMKNAIGEASGAGAETQLVQTAGITPALRAVKDAGELELLSRAIEIGDQAFDEVSATLEPGVTEAEVAWRIEQAMRTRGAEAVSFDTIVACGPSAALPHHRAGDDELREGETIVIDMGARYRGYCGDLTRTVVIGRSDDRFRRVYDTVLAAQLTAIETIASGMTGKEADRLARVVIEECGYGERFGHGLGHGVGLEVHEKPTVGVTSADELADGMVFSVEPGVYIPGWGGVRIEDLVVLENGRARVLSKARKQPEP